MKHVFSSRKTDRGGLTPCPSCAYMQQCADFQGTRAARLASPSVHTHKHTSLHWEENGFLHTSTYLVSWLLWVILAKMSFVFVDSCVALPLESCNVAANQCWARSPQGLQKHSHGTEWQASNKHIASPSMVSWRHFLEFRNNTPLGMPVFVRVDVLFASMVAQLKSQSARLEHDTNQSGLRMQRRRAWAKQQERLRSYAEGHCVR